MQLLALIIAIDILDINITFFFKFSGSEWLVMPPVMTKLASSQLPFFSARSSTASRTILWSLDGTQLKDVNEFDFGLQKVAAVCPIPDNCFHNFSPLWFYCLEEKITFGTTHFFGLLKSTVWWHYNTVNFLPNTHNRHSIPHSSGWAMACLLWVFWRKINSLIKNYLVWDVFMSSESAYHMYYHS